MPVFRRPDSSLITDPHQQAELMATLALRVRRIGSRPSATLPQVVAARHLAPAAASALLEDFDLPGTRHYAGRDVIALFPETPDLAQLEQTFLRPHRHADAEVRFLLWGEGIFGFVLPDGSQVEITVTAGDLIDIAPETEHWFRLGEARELIALRLFSDQPRWAALFTGTVRQFTP